MAFAMLGASDTNPKWAVFHEQPPRGAQFFCGHELLGLFCPNTGPGYLITWKRGLAQNPTPADLDNWPDMYSLGCETHIAELRADRDRLATCVEQIRTWTPSTQEVS